MKSICKKKYVRRIMIILLSCFIFMTGRIFYLYPESVNAAKNIMGTGISLSKYPNSHLQRDEMHS